MNTTPYMKSTYVCPNCDIYRFKVESGYLTTEPTSVSGSTLEKTTEEEGEW